MYLLQYDVILCQIIIIYYVWHLSHFITSVYLYLFAYFINFNLLIFDCLNGRARIAPNVLVYSKPDLKTMRQPRSGKQHQASHWEDQSQMTSISTWTGTKSGHALLVDCRLQHIETVFPSFFIVHILF